MKKLKPGIFLRNGIVYVRVTRHRKDRWKSFGRKSPEAMRRAQLHVLKIKAETKTEFGPPLLGPFVQEWAEGHGKRKRCAQKLKDTLSRFERYAIPFFGARRRLDSIDSPDLTAYGLYLENEIGLKPSTVKDALSDLRAVMNQARRVKDPLTKEPRLKEVPAFTDAMPREDELAPRRVTPRDLGLIFRAELGQTDGEVLEVLFGTGLRWSELQKLRRDLVILEKPARIELERTKGKRVRRVPLTPRVQTIFRSWFDREKSVMACPYRAIGGNALATRVRRTVAALGEEAEDFRFTVHMARHTFASNWIVGGGSLIGLMEALGHKDIRTTMRYVSLLMGHITQEVERLSEHLDVALSVARDVAVETAAAQKG